MNPKTVLTAMAVGESYLGEWRLSECWKIAGGKDWYARPGSKVSGRLYRSPQSDPQQVGKPSQSLRRRSRKARLPGKPCLELSSKAAAQPPEFEYE